MQVLHRIVEEQSSRLDGGTELVSYFIEETRRFLDHFQRHVVAQNYETAFDLMLVAVEMYPRMQGLFMASDLADANLGPPTPIVDGSELEIVSRVAPTSLDELTDVLDAISGLYSEVAKLLGVSSRDEPIKIIKLESGSLYLKLKGAVKIVAVVVHVLRRALSYGVANHALSGRFDSLPKAADSIENILRVREVLVRNGADVSEMDGEIEAASLKLAKHANALVSHMAEIGVNGEVFSVKEQLLIGLERNSSQKLLNHEEKDRPKE